MSRETRAFTVPMEVRAAKEGEARKIVGHAAVFDQLSEDLGGFREKIAQGAFANAVKSGDVRALWNHNSDLVMARNKSGTLQLRETDMGLECVITPPDTEMARHWLATIERGDVSQMSFGFRTITDQWTRDLTTGEVTRTLIEVDLFDVSPVAFPAYPQTDVATRSLGDFRKREDAGKVRRNRAWCADHIALLEIA